MWLDGQLATDADGSFLTGLDNPLSHREPGERTPQFLETSQRGSSASETCAVSIKRIATAIGEGSMACASCFDRLQDSGVSVTDPSRLPSRD